MKKFGEAWEEPKKAPGEGGSQGSNEEAKHMLPQGDPNDFAPPQWVNMLPIFITVIAGICIFVGVFMLSGADVSMGTPRVLVLVFEGFKGTVFNEVVFGTNKAPNLKSLVNDWGISTECLSTGDSMCCKAQSGASLGTPYSWTSSPGIASILTGVNANKHLVSNDTFEAMSAFFETSNKYATFLSKAFDNGYRTAAIGSTHLLTTISPVTTRCTDYGILDMECGRDAVSLCLRTSSCDLTYRVPLQSTSEGADESLIPGEFEVLLEKGLDVAVVHFNKLDTIAKTRGDYTSASRSYLGQIYLTDAMVGQIYSLVKTRAYELRENWLVIGVGDHGGFAHASGATPAEDEVVPFFVSVITSSGRLTLMPPKAPVRQYDVAPTALQWLGLLDSASAALMDGSVQSICSNGKAPANCTVDV